MEQAIARVKAILENDSTVMADSQAVELTWAPERRRPYITVMLYENTREYGLMLEGPLELDIWDDGPSKVRADRIQRRCRQLLHEKFLTLDHAGAARLSIDRGGFLTDEDPSVVRYNLVFNLRAWEQHLASV